MANRNIGITYYVKENGSIFGSSRGQTALMLRKVLQACGHNVTLVHCSNEVKWWEDATGLEGKTISLIDCSGLDLLIDIDATLSGEIRKKIAKKTVGFLRGRVLFNELENASYLQQNIVRIMDGLDEVWFWDIFNPEEDLGPLGSLFKIQVRLIPFIWEPFILDNYLKISGVTKNLAKSGKPTFHIAEKNTSNTSSAIIPLCSLVELNKTFRVDTVKVHNGIELQQTSFFKTNILPNLLLDNIEYTGRERFAGWLEEDNPFVITHCRYVPFRYSMLDLAYLGIPFVHNSKLLSKLGVNGYYKDNSISGLCEAILASGVTKPEPSLASPDSAPDFSIWSVEHQKEKWLAMDLFLAKPDLAPEPFAKARETQKKKIRLGFANMWEGFNSSSNFFVDLLNHYGYETDGVSDLENIDLLIFGPFGETTPDVNCPKVFFTGENIAEPEKADLYLTFNPVEDDTHIRLPLWMLFLNWFDKDIDKTQNPQTLPVSLAKYSYPTGFEDRSEDFSFVVSNPSNELRNEVFLKLVEKYKVNSGGALYNNIGKQIKCLYGGGGAGDIAKHEFLEKHKFNICFENSKGEGYVTEKLLHAKLAGCVPIYWGSPEAAKDFNPEGFIDVSDCSTADEVVEKISGLLVNEAALREMARTPALDAQRFQAARNKLSDLANILASLSGTRTPEIKITHTDINIPIFISYVTSKYVESAIINIKSVQEINSQIPYRIYLGPDVTPEEKKSLQVYKNIQLVEMDTYYKPSSFGWKLDILYKTVNEPELRNKLIIYTDAGAQWISLPEDLLNTAYEKGICFLLDPDNNTNYQWCSKEMQEEYRLTHEELEARQILAGFQIFRGGHDLPVKVFNEAFRAAANPTILEGEKYIGFLPDGKLHGHRHDQSILSTLRIRFNVPSISASGIVNEKTLRLTKLSKCSIYLHRGNYQTHTQPLPNIDDIWIINLDRRQDRLTSLYESAPFLKQIANRFSAVDGKELQLTPTISKLIDGNDFINKKSVTAVALSHIMLWAQLVADESANSYLILEDDVRFNSFNWEHISAHIPTDAELLYLGGILPGNRAAYKECILQVNDVWATIKPNEYFTPGRPTSTFHFCAYSYIITKSGAKKLLEALEQIGCFTSIDHFLGHPMFGLNKYVLQDLVTTCFQENDPEYINAEFDNFKRIDTFDSDIWNNVECWSEEEIKNKITTRPSINRLIQDILYQVASNPITDSLLKQNLPLKNLYYKETYDKSYLEKLSKLGMNFNLVEFSDIAAAADSEPLFLIQDIAKWQETLNKYTSANIHFNVLDIKKINILLDNIIAIKSTLDNNQIPLYVRTKDDEEYWKWLKTTFNLVELTTEGAKEKLVSYFNKNPVAETTYLNGIKNNMKKFITKLHISLYR